MLADLVVDRNPLEAPVNELHTTKVPMIYQCGPDNRQYVAVAASGNGAFKTSLSDAITSPHPAGLKRPRLR